jgi:SAM-dependent methyltransferase
MLTKFSSDLKTQDIFATGDEHISIMGKKEVESDIYVHTFIDPVLVTDNYRIGQLSPTLRDTLFALYSSWPRTIEYDDVGVTWDNKKYVGVWGPSIDTLLIAKSLKKILKNNSTILTALEVGCGSGYLSKYILSNCNNLQSMSINDINPYAIRCAKDNVEDSRAQFIDGDGLKLLSQSTYDLIVCNPPYVPRPDSVEINPYEGIEILNTLVHNCKKYLNPGGYVVIGLSNLADRIVFVDKPELTFKTVEEMEVPLKINNVLNNSEWIDYLQDRNLQKNNHNGYDFWHRIKVICAQNI